MLDVLHNVRLHGCSPQILFAILAAEKVYATYDLICHVTSARDGEHQFASLHYAGEAVDIDLPNDLHQARVDELVDDLRYGLTVEYDVVAEKVGQAGSHIHIEFQPKGL